MEKLLCNAETALNDLIRSDTRDDDLLGFYLSIFVDMEVIQTTIWTPFEAFSESVLAD